MAAAQGGSPARGDAGAHTPGVEHAVSGGEHVLQGRWRERWWWWWWWWCFELLTTRRILTFESSDVSFGRVAAHCRCCNQFLRVRISNGQAARCQCDVCVETMNETNQISRMLRADLHFYTQTHYAEDIVASFKQRLHTDTLRTTPCAGSGFLQQSERLTNFKQHSHRTM